MIRSARNVVRGSRSLCTRQRSVADPGRGVFRSSVGHFLFGSCQYYVCRDSAVSNPVLIAAGTSSCLFHNSNS